MRVIVLVIGMAGLVRFLVTAESMRVAVRSTDGTKSGRVRRPKGAIEAAGVNWTLKGEGDGYLLDRAVRRVSRSDRSAAMLWVGAARGAGLAKAEPRAGAPDPAPQSGAV